MAPSGDLLDAARNPTETLRLIDQLEVAYVRLGLGWGRAAAQSLRERTRSAELLGRLWVGPQDEAVGLATWDEEAEVGRRLSVFLAEGFQKTAALRSFLDRLAADAEATGTPVIAWYDQVPGLPFEAQREVFGPRGAFHVVRRDLVYPLDRALFEAPGPPPPGVRGLSVDNERAVARLLRVAYADNPVEQAVFVRYRDPQRDAEASAHDLLHERYGRWMSEASFAVFDGPDLVAAVLVNDFRGPLITEVMTAPSHRRRGFASHLLRESLRSLRAHGAATPRLVVTTWNERAHRLYRELGFQYVPGSEGGVWLDLARLGLPQPSAPPGA